MVIENFNANAMHLHCIIINPIINSNGYIVKFSKLNVGLKLLGCLTGCTLQVLAAHARTAWSQRCLSTGSPAAPCVAALAAAGFPLPSGAEKPATLPALLREVAERCTRRVQCVAPSDERACKTPTRPVFVSISIKTLYDA
jgi:hypothetical protein